MKHGTALIGGGEYTLCGVAFDAYESGDEPAPVEFALPGEVVSCPECRRAIDYARTFKRYSAPHEKTHE